VSTKQVARLRVFLFNFGDKMEIEGYEIDDLFDSENLESVERKVDFERLLSTLSERDRRIAVLYAFGHTQVEIGAIVGLCDQRISQILANIRKRGELLGE
jgi:DNA-directed RNA polymerase specialized sigma subunit